MAWCRRAGPLAARHWGIGVLLGCGAGLRAVATIAYWPALVYIDTPRYLGHDAHGLDPLGYRYLFLRPLLMLHAGLSAAAIAQHLLGLALGTAMYALIVRHGAPRWLAALAAAPVLLDAYQVQAEQMIMPDVFFEALLGAAVLLLAWPGPRTRPGPGTRPGARLAAAALVLGIAATVRQTGELAAIPLLGYASTAGAAPGSAAGAAPAARAKAAVTALAVFAVPVAGYMALSATVLGTGFRLSDMDDAYLYARVADAADCATLRVPAYERPLCPGIAGTKAGIDALATAADSPLYTYRPPRGVGRGAAIISFDTAVLAQQPLRVAAGIGGDAVKVFALTRAGSPGDPPLDRWQFQTAYPVYRDADRAVFGPDARWPGTEPGLATALRWYQLRGGFTPGPLVLMFGIAAAAGALSRRAPRSLRAGAAVTAGLALAVVGGADLYEFSWRYQLPVLITLPPAGILGALAACRNASTRNASTRHAGALPRRSASEGTMNRCTRNRLTLSLRSGRSPAASCTPIRGSGSARTKSSDATGPGAPTPSSNGTTSP